MSYNRADPGLRTMDRYTGTSPPMSRLNHSLARLVRWESHCQLDWIFDARVPLHRLGFLINFVTGHLGSS
jgi:hypothetical protein